MLIFSIKNAFRKKLTAILASLGVGFGLMLVFVIGAFTAGVTAQFQDNLSKTLGIVSVTEEFQTGANSHLPLDLPDALFNTPGVGDSIVSYNVETEAPLSLTSEYFKDPDPDKLILKGLNITIDQAWGGATSKIIEGRLFEVDKNETIIDSRLLDVSGFPSLLGSNITIDLGNNTRNLEVVGVYEQDDTGAPSFVPRDYYIYVDIQLIWDLLEDAGKVSNIYTLISLRFDVENHDDTEKFVDRINEYSENDGYSPKKVTAFSLAGFLREIEETFAIFDAFTTVLSIIVVLAGGMAVIVTQLMSVSSRMKEFAILKSTGWKNRHIFQDVIYESLILGLLGALIGLGIGSILIYVLGGSTSPFGGASAIITFQGIFEVFAYAFGLGILGGLYPGIKASRVRLVLVLKGE